MPVLKSEVLALLEQYQTEYEEELLFYTRLEKFVSEEGDPFSRYTEVGHVTASAWVVDADTTSAFLIHHRKLDKWFQPGGHIEYSDDSLLKACKREAVEETGIADLMCYNNSIFDIDIHTIPERGNVQSHLHYDVRMLFIAKDRSYKVQKEEVSGGQWILIDKLLKGNWDNSIQRMARKTKLLSS